MLESMMLVHRSCIDRLDVPARAIFGSPAVFKWEALCMKVDPNDIRTPDVEELGQTSRLYTLHCGIELNEEQNDEDTAAAAAGQQMSHSDRQNHHLWLKSKANT